MTTYTGLPIEEREEAHVVVSSSSESYLFPPVKNPFSDDLNNASFSAKEVPGQSTVEGLKNPVDVQVILILSTSL